MKRMEDIELNIVFPHFSDPQRVTCSRMCAMPVESCGTVLKWTENAFVSSLGFEKWI